MNRRDAITVWIVLAALASDASADAADGHDTFGAFIRLSVAFASLALATATWRAARRAARREAGR